MLNMKPQRNIIIDRARFLFSVFLSPAFLRADLDGALLFFAAGADLARFFLLLFLFFFPDAIILILRYVQSIQ
ncbi:MAG: hypothetical protein ACLFP8_00610 [Alphaproteobacteria bacterium]